MKELLAFLILASVITVAAEPNNPQPLPDDLVLPMPGGAKMVFRPVALDVGDGPFAVREFVMGGRGGESFQEHPTKVVLGGSFRASHGGRADWIYYLGKYEVSVSQFDAVMSGGTASMSNDVAAMPKVNVSWFEAQEFLRRYNEWLFAQAHAQVPHLDGRPGFVRLPTEAEWEFAARGGAMVSGAAFDERTPYGSGLVRYEWFGGAESSHGKLKPIGLLKSNPLGLHDMLGNAKELTEQLYRIEYVQGRCGGLVYRGGSFRTPAVEMRASARAEVPIYGLEAKPTKSDFAGFRVALATPIFSSGNIRAIEAAWPEYTSRRSVPLPGSRASAPVVEQTGEALADISKALNILEAELGRSEGSDAARAQLGLVRASFMNLEATVNRGEKRYAAGGVRLLSIASTQIMRTFRKMHDVPRQKALTPEEIAADAEILAAQEKNLVEARALYELTLRDLAQVKAEIVATEFASWLTELRAKQIPDQVAATELAQRHCAVLAHTKRVDLQNWFDELRALAITNRLGRGGE